MLDNGSKGWVSFKYERLPNICYWCARLNHFDKDYDLWIESNGTLTQADQQYGPWIRATSMLNKKNTMMVVLGYYEKKKEKEKEKRNKLLETHIGGNLLHPNRVSHKLSLNH